jgi:hypothetical protein
MFTFFCKKTRKTLLASAVLVSLALCWQSDAAPAPVTLPNFSIEIHQTSVSGLSSGAFMAVQFGVAYSAVVKGAGVIAGGPYYCARGDVTTAITICSCTGLPFFFSCRVAPGATKVNELVGITDQNARDGTIDPSSNLARHRVWMLSGNADSIVPQAVMNDLHAYYGHYVNRANIHYKTDLPAQHAMPTDSFGGDCSKLGTPYINNCHFDAAGELLKWIYGADLQPKNSGRLNGRLVEFSQREFFADRTPTAHGMADSGFLYVPKSCETGNGQRCKLHVAFHGCQQDSGSIRDTYVQHAGYNQWADTNHMIILYPQTASSRNNPKACWDWFDFDGDNPDYAKKSGRQTAAVKAMIDRLAGMTAAPVPGAGASAACITATNAEHISAGRAHPGWFFTARANGSNDYMGFNNIFMTTTLKQTGRDFFVIASCS